MKVVEIFDSMQGEGNFIGEYVTFVRFAGCNLHCSFCDEASKYGKAKDMSIAQIVKKCKQQRIVLTGGEPTLQIELERLITELIRADKNVSIETNGTNAVPLQLQPQVWITCSPKAPLYKINCHCDEIKLVVSEDLKFSQAVAIADTMNLPVRLQPCDGPYIEKSKDVILKWIKKDPAHFRAGIQLHKWYEVQ